MSKLSNYLVLLLAVPPFTSRQEKKAEVSVPEWILSMVSDGKNTSVETDFSNILSGKSVPYVGYIGTDYQKLSIDLQKIQRIGDNQYNVSGITTVKNSRCDFRGTTDIVESREFTHPTYGADDFVEDQFMHRGCSIVKYNLEEETSRTGNGVFASYLLFYWYETNDGKFVYDDIDSHSDSHCNNQYAGVWKSNKTRKSKPCAWGQYRVPGNEDLGVGIGKFSANPKYAKNGWEKW